MDKKTGQYGKLLQREVCDKCGFYPNHAQKYEDWIRKVNTGKNGVFVDIDLIKVQQRANGQYVPKVITDLTYAKSHEPAYLKAIKDRWFSRDDQGKIFQGIAQAMNIPALLVAYGGGKVSVLDILDPDLWQTYTTGEWAEQVETM